MNPSQPFRVLFVCMGNICRSPAGENIFRHVVQREGWSHTIEIDSAGTIGYHTGKEPDSRMSKTLKKRGYKVSGAARKITSDDLLNFDLILTMDEDNYRNVRQLSNSPPLLNKVKRFTDYCTEHDDTAVPDPYYGGQSGFEYVADLIEDGSETLLQEIRRSFS